MIYIRNILFYFSFYIWTTLFFISFSPVRYFTKSFAMVLSKFWTGSIVFLAKKILGINYEVIGKKNTFKNQSMIIASNHQSPWETFFFVFFFENPVFILKEELKKVPIMSWYFKKLDFIFIDRDKKINSLKQIILAVKKLNDEDNRTIIIFPEGTRVSPGQKVKLNSGVYALHKILGLPVYPVKHNSGQYWTNKKFLKFPGTIKISLFPEIKLKEKNRFLEKIENHYYRKN